MSSSVKGSADSLSTPFVAVKVTSKTPVSLAFPSIYTKYLCVAISLFSIDSLISSHANDISASVGVEKVVSPHYNFTSPPIVTDTGAPVSLATIALYCSLSG